MVRFADLRSFSFRSLTLSCLIGTGIACESSARSGALVNAGGVPASAGGSAGTSAGGMTAVGFGGAGGFGGATDGGAAGAAGAALLDPEEVPDAAILDLEADAGAEGDDAGAVVDPIPGAEADALFTTTGIARIDLTLTQEAIDALWADSATYVPGDVSVELGDARILELSQIGVRLKGRFGSARNLDQKSAFLLKFNAFEQGKDLLSLKKLALNNMVQDASMIHEQLAYTLFRAAGVPAPRTSYARVFLNGELYGLYATIEVVDNEEFLERWYGSDDGNLYEGSYGTDLNAGNVGGFDQDRGEDVAFADLEELAVALDQMTDPSTFLTDANQVLDIQRYVQFAATEIFLGDWDGYAWTRNNYFLYRGPDLRWTFMPWGKDQTFVDYLEPFGGDGRVERMCTASLACRLELAAAFRSVATRITSLGLMGEVDRLRALIEEAMQEDPRKELSADEVHFAQDEMKAFMIARPTEVEAGLACTDPSTVDGDSDGASGCGEDCNDSDPAIFPGAEEACNIQDDNCDGQLDEGGSCPACVTENATGGGEYALCYRSLSFADAEADCVLQGGHLVSLHSDEQAAEVIGFAHGLLQREWWIGLSDVDDEGDFTWVDGTELDYEHWSDGEPNDAGENEDCAHFAGGGDGPWNDLGCGAELPYVCALPE